MRHTGRRLAAGILALLLVAATTSACTKRNGEGAATSAGSHVVHPGDRGEHVARLQRDLRLLGIDVAMDGIYSSSTQSSVEELQHFFDLTVDGIVGPATHKLIASLVAQNVQTTIVPVGPDAATEVIGHPTTNGYCFELLAQERGASVCVPGGVPLALRFVRIDPELPPLVVAVGGEGVARVVVQRDDGTSTELALFPLAGQPQQQAAVASGFGDRPHAFRALGADGTEVAVIVSRSSPVDDLALGDVGPAVLALQDQLRALGAVVVADGVYSVEVASTVAGIQRFFGLEAHGRVDEPTRALVRALATEESATV